MKSVILRKPRPPNMAGEVCGFSDELADAMVARGDATFPDPAPEAEAAVAAAPAKTKAKDEDKPEPAPAEAKAAVVQQPPQAAVVRSPVAPSRK